MSQFVDVEEFFSSVYLVDFSPSLCEIARKRFARLGWKNVKVVCQDARTFRLEHHENSAKDTTIGFRRLSTSNYFTDEKLSVGGAELITMSYSLSMIVGNLFLFGRKLLTAVARFLLRHRFAHTSSRASGNNWSC